ncbi:MAG: hypothetical protein AB8B50_01375 [Pirellulaceae bacterium]
MNADMASTDATQGDFFLAGLFAPWSTADLSALARRIEAGFGSPQSRKKGREPAT